MIMKNSTFKLLTSIVLMGLFAFVYSCSSSDVSQVKNGASTAVEKATSMADKAKSMAEKPMAAVENVKLTQTVGKFTTENLTLAPGKYQFEIANSDVDHEVGFVLVPKGKYDAADHIKAAYVKAPVAQGSSSMTSVVDLAAGEYEYFCPLNPTPKYSLTKM